MVKNKIVTGLNFLIKPIIERYRDSNVKNNAYYINCVRKKYIKSNRILFESCYGINFTGNVYSIFRNVIENFPRYKCYLAIKDLNDPMIQWIKKSYKNKNIEIVEYQSKKYLRALATAKYLVNDTAFLPYFNKRKGQIYLNTWHGTPLEKFGKNIASTRFNYNENIQKNLYSTDKMALPNKFTAEKLVESNDLMGILNAEIGFLGNARMDLTLNSNKDYVYNKYNLDKEQIIILYAPTYRKDAEQITKEYVDELIREVIIIQKEMGNNYTVYLKPDYLVSENFISEEYFKYVIPDWVDTNELLSIVDILITDNSNIFFDFLPLKRPIYFYMKDKNKYGYERDLYFDACELPGSVSQSIAELLKNLNIRESTYLNKYQNKMEKFIKNYCFYDDGKSALRSVNFLFEDNKRVRLYKSSKKVVVFYGGGFYNNGITNSLINLSRFFDYNKYEFVLIKTDKIFNDKISNLCRLDSRVHIITQFANINRNIRDTLEINMFYRQGYNSKYISKKRVSKIFKEYFHHNMGNIQPEVTIDYSGYNKLFTSIFAFAPVKNKSIFLHNDMYEEFNKVINGRYKHRWNLKVIFSLYNQFSKIVSVSESTNQANISNLKKFIELPERKMISIPNVIDGDNVIKKAKLAYDEPKTLPISNNNFRKKHLIHKLDHNTLNNLYFEGAIKPNPQDVNFVNVARLSEEKNQKNLIKAFKQIVQENNRCRLYILGDGPLYEKLVKLIKYLQLENHVYLLGFLPNPYIFIEKCDCFILTSNYEGQGMSVLEAQILNKPVIGTNVNGIKSIINENSGVLVENNVYSIIEGLKQYLNGNVPSIYFNYKNYNINVISKFEREVL